MKQIFFLLMTLAASIATAQKLPDAPLPDIVQNNCDELFVTHFPPVVHVSTDKDRPGEYFWKHNTAVMSVKDVKIVEFGAYIYYNDQWNHRATYGPKEFAKWFGCRKAHLKGGQPYTYNDNWRAQTSIFAGWALWYFIVEDEDGVRSCGYKPLYTSDQLLTNSNIR